MQWFVRSFGVCLMVLWALRGGQAWAQERGFQLDRYDGPSASSSLLLLERPTYSGTSFGAAGITLGYAHRPLVPRLLTGRGNLEPLVLHSLVGTVVLSGSLFDRVLISASLPVSLLELGTPELVSQVGPLQTVGIGDPRVGLMVRLAGQADRDGISLHLGSEVWIPIGAQATHQGDATFRVMPRVVLAGAFLDVGRWTLDGAFLFRPYASFGPPALGMTAASEARVGLALGVALADERFTLGPEARFAMQVVGDNAFAVNGMNLEVLGSAQYLIADTFRVGIAGGSAFFGAAGTPDARGLVRLVWAPRRNPTPKRPSVEELAREADANDPDGDGIATADDRCPYEPETVNGVRDADGCPEFELKQGSPLARVLANVVRVPSGVAAPDAGVVAPANVVRAPSGVAAPDAGVVTPVEVVRAPEVVASPDAGTERMLALITVDSDGDGVPDEADRCPVAREDLDGFEDDDGCPEADNDEDGVADATDTCPMEGETRNGLDDSDGCPDMAPDADLDGVADGVDRCPFEPENLDGVRDEDGCPEHPVAQSVALAKLLSTPPVTALLTPLVSTSAPEASQPLDSDSDGVTDDADRCPVTAEDRDGFEDEDGCPELDDDEDGIADAQDKCPLAAETVNGWKDDDGCPDEHQDVDGDGVEYEVDRCPLEPGNASDGCPHAALPALALEGFPGAAPVPASSSPTPEAAAPSTADFDRDGTPDEADACPMSAEDRDDFEDEDGCPEPDDDHDGIEDAKDKCPLVAETINGIKDTDGCPDVGEGAVTIEQHAVVIKGVVRFQTGSANLQPASLPLLLQVASTLRAASTLSIEIQGHTDDVGNAAQNIRLSKRRAETIRGVLIKAGVAPTRLIATGFGPTRPLASNKTPKGRDQNRRVEFLILGESK